MDRQTGRWRGMQRKVSGEGRSVPDSKQVAPNPSELGVEISEVGVETEGANKGGRWIVKQTGK